MLRRCLATAACLLGLFPAALTAQDGVSETEVRFAQLAQLDGAFGLYGRAFHAGVRAAFDEANAAGGVHGRRVYLDNFDDGSEPERAVDLVRAIAGDGTHLAIIGAADAESARAIQPILKQKKVPMLAAASGDPLLREPAMAHLRNLRPSISEEAESWVRYLVEEAGLSRITVLYRADTEGRQGVEAVTAALERRGHVLLARASYPRNTMAVKVALLKLKRAEPQAIIVIGEHAPVVGILETAAMLDYHTLFLVGAKVSGEAIRTRFGEDVAELVVSHPLLQALRDEDLPLSRDFLSARTGEEEDAVFAFEGYLAGRFALEILQTAGRDLDRGAFLKAMRSLKQFDIGGVPLEFKLGDNQGLDTVGLARMTPDGPLAPL